MEISYNDFNKIEIRVGKILEARVFKEAKKPAYQLLIDFGKFGLKHSSAQITKYSIGDLIGKEVVAVTNSPPKLIAAFKSEVLVLGVNNSEGDVILVEPDKVVPLGNRIY